jgi:hypothetical protein
MRLDPWRGEEGNKTRAPLDAGLFWNLKLMVSSNDKFANKLVGLFENRW